MQEAWLRGGWGGHWWREFGSPPGPVQGVRCRARPRRAEGHGRGAARSRTVTSRIAPRLNIYKVPEPRLVSTSNALQGAKPESLSHFSRLAFQELAVRCRSRLAQTPWRSSCGPADLASPFDGEEALGEDVRRASRCIRHATLDSVRVARLPHYSPAAQDAPSSLPGAGRGRRPDERRA